MTKNPQDDLTAERAAKLVEAMLVFIEKTSRRKLSFSVIVDMNTGETKNPQDRLVAAVIKHDQQTRQKALREGMTLAAEEADMHVCDDPRFCHCSSRIYKAIMDRLASEGG